LSIQQVLPLAERIPPLLYPDPRPPNSRSHRVRDFAVPRRLFGSWWHRHRPEVVISYRPLVEAGMAELRPEEPLDLASVEICHDESAGPTAGVRHNCRRVGELATELLAGQRQYHARGVPPVPTSTLVEGTWIGGDSLPVRSSVGAEIGVNFA